MYLPQKEKHQYTTTERTKDQKKAGVTHHTMRLRCNTKSGSPTAF